MREENGGEKEEWRIGGGTTERIGHGRGGEREEERGKEERRSGGEERRREGDREVRGLTRRAEEEEDERRRGGKGRTLHVDLPGHFILPSYLPHTFEQTRKPLEERKHRGEEEARRKWEEIANRCTVPLILPSYFLHTFERIRTPLRVFSLAAR
jgi:hypothetical protein